MATGDTPTPAQQKLIDEAAAALATAHSELEVAMGQVSGSIRADKTMISATIRSALDRLAAAQLRLGELREPKR